MLKSKPKPCLLSPALDLVIRSSQWVQDLLFAQTAWCFTNYHVIENAHAVTVKLPDGREFRAQGLLESDPELDVAVLKIEATGLPTIPLGDSDRVKVGQRVIAIGNPLGVFEYTVSDGIISAIRLDDSPEAKLKKLLQITVPASHGSSGGLLLDLSGQEIGITFAIIELGQNFNFAIPIPASP